MRITTLLISSCLTAAFLLSACEAPSAQQTSEAELIVNESAALNDWLEERFQDDLTRSPMLQTYYGEKGAASFLDDVSQMANDEDAALTQQWLFEMRERFDLNRLDAQTALSYRLFEHDAEDQLSSHAYSDHQYIFEHMSGPHSDLPTFMINFHAIDSLFDAEDYIARLSEFDAYLGQMADKAEAQFEAGVSLPKFVYDKITPTAENIIKGRPFTDGEDSPLLADFKSKIERIELSNDERTALIQDANAALTEHVGPAYENLIDLFTRHKESSSADDGAWKLPKGAEFYQARLKHYTTTDLTADEIHEIGLKEVARIQDEMRAIMTQVGFEGDLKAFYDHLRTDPKFVYSDDDAGRAAYIADATAMINEMKAQLDDLFITKPQADMIVKRVEAFREDTAFGAFYDQPALDGSRPGTYYINLRDIKDQPKYLMQALAYHEGIPGHHMQIAIAMELQGLPKFRTLGGHTSYVEGWALYSESVPKELGLYTDPYMDFGRLSMEIFRAARLVVDTGIHAKKWTREEAVQYYLDNIPNPEGDVRAEIDRYIVWPGQATAYKIGMLKIQELRKNAELELGEKFDIREFHDVILASGSVPLTILEELVADWTASKTRGE
ncbi:MAG: DUF885 domain-containing protein [Maricaulaceae bacterium]